VEMLLNEVLETFVELLVSIYLFKPNQKKKLSLVLHIAMKESHNTIRFTYSLFFLQVRSVMIDNIDKVLERGDRLELLVDKTANMQGNTVRFKRQARRFRNTTWWRNVKLTYGIF
jgi:hypothetical protein